MLFKNDISTNALLGSMYAFHIYLHVEQVQMLVLHKAT